MVVLEVRNWYRSQKNIPVADKKWQLEKTSETALVSEVRKQESFRTSETVLFQTTYGYIVLKRIHFGSFQTYKMVRFGKK